MVRGSQHLDRALLAVVAYDDAQVGLLIRAEGIADRGHRLYQFLPADSSRRSPLLLEREIAQWAAGANGTMSAHMYAPTAVIPVKKTTLDVSRGHAGARAIQRSPATAPMASRGDRRRHIIEPALADPEHGDTGTRYIHASMR